MTDGIVGSGVLLAPFFITPRRSISLFHRHLNSNRTGRGRYLDNVVIVPTRIRNSVDDIFDFESAARRQLFEQRIASRDFFFFEVQPATTITEYSI